jgi:hypothetical protein
MLASGFLASEPDSFAPDISDRYSSLKAAWDSLVEAANHGHPRAFHAAVTVVLEQPKRGQQPKK